MTVFGKLNLWLAVFSALSLLRPEPAFANSPQQNGNALSQLHNHMASGQIGEDILNFFGTSSGELSENWENRGAFADELGQRLQNGKAAEDLGALGVGVLKGGWAGVTEIAALGWDGLAALGMGMAYGQQPTPDALVQALDEYQPASSLIQAIKESKEQGIGPGEFTMGILQSLAETPADFLRSMWNDPENAGAILSQFLLRKMALKGLRKGGSRALSTRRAGAGAAGTANPCKITRCSIADDLKSVTRSSSAPTTPSRVSAGRTAQGAAALAPSQSLRDAMSNIQGRRLANTQLRHIRNTQQWFEKGQKSYFLSKDDAQAVLDAFHEGRAVVLGAKGTGPNANLFVRVDGVKGFNQNRGAGFMHQETNVFMFKGTSRISVVPQNPNWQPKAP